jgi:hypothetical protein
MNSQLLDQLATQRNSEIQREAAARHLAARGGLRGSSPATAAAEPRDTIRQRAGWTLIHVGLKLTGPPAPSRPRTASL